jgi:hypothetical protein
VLCVGVRALPVLSPEAMAELVRVPTAAHDLTIPTPTKMVTHHSHLPFLDTTMIARLLMPRRSH